MFEELDILKKKLDNYRPIDSNKMIAIQEKLRIDWTYNSNAIEGNTLSLSETAFFLREGLTSKGKPLSEYLEAKNHAEAIDYLDEIVKGKRPLTEGLIKEYHTLIMKDTKYIWIGHSNNRVKKKIEPGKYKYDNNHVIKLDGTIHYFCDYLQVPGEMEKLIKWYNENKDKLHPVELSAVFHHKFVAIHPFTDGNGRVGRLILNTILMQEGYTPAIIKMEDHQEYYQALDEADREEHTHFIEMVEREVTNTMTLMLNVIEGKEAFSKEDLKRRLGIFEEKIEKLDRDIGIVSKEVDEEKRKYSEEQICQFLETLTKEAIEEHKSEMMEFRIEKPSLSNLEFIFQNSYIKIYLENKNIIISSEDARIINKMIINGLQIKLISRRKYIPNSTLTFAIISTRFTMIAISISKLEQDTDAFDKPRVIDSIQGGALWEDWDKRDLEDFFVEVFNEFLKQIELEIEKRRIATS
ncbi:MAG: Fic family protein [bacterium]|nr:Fic family protein [bacterium]